MKEIKVIEGLVERFGNYAQAHDYGMDNPSGVEWTRESWGCAMGIRILLDERHKAIQRVLDYENELKKWGWDSVDDEMEMINGQNPIK